MIICILCGGSGTRLWPLSRVLMPKQFTELIGDKSLFNLTLRRNQNLNCDKRFQVITNDAQYFLALDESLEENVKVHSFILESISRNTAPALVFGALDVLYQNLENDVILAIPSDHIIHGFKEYEKNVFEAINLAKDGYIVTFGIKPTKPHTGYGYIKSSKNNDVDGFFEKPKLELAEQYLQEGNYFWNSGMFCYKATTFLDEIQKYEPLMFELCKRIFDISNKCEFKRLDKTLSAKLPNLSIDYAVMEKSDKLKVVKSNFKWNDVGSFDSLDEEYSKDLNLNSSKNKIEVINSKNNLIISDKLVATIGLNGFVIVDTNDALMIAKKGETQKVKDIVNKLSVSNEELINVHKKAYRPWGHYVSLQKSSTYRLKNISLKPKKELSLQKHYHRNEHWIVVKGIALIQIEDQKMLLKINESTYIPSGKKYKISNPGIIDLVLIEIQIGEYLHEDDVIELNDIKN